MKIVLDGVFAKENFRTEISWKRQSAHNDAKQGRKQYGNVRDIIFFYTNSDAWQWKWLYTPYTEDYIKDFYRFVEKGSDRRYRLSDLTAPGGASPEKRNPHYEFLGVTRYWRYTKENMEKLYSEVALFRRALAGFLRTSVISTKCLALVCRTIGTIFAQPRAMNHLGTKPKNH